MHISYRVWLVGLTDGQSYGQMVESFGLHGIIGAHSGLTKFSMAQTLLLGLLDHRHPPGDH